MPEVEDKININFVTWCPSKKTVKIKINKNQIRECAEATVTPGNYVSNRNHSPVIMVMDYTRNT